MGNDRPVGGSGFSYTLRACEIAFRAGAEGPKYCVDNHLQPQSSSKNTLPRLVIPQTNEYNRSMKFTVIRYHSSPVSFSSLIEAMDFAMNCGDFSEFLIEKAGQASLSEV